MANNFGQTIPPGSQLVASTATTNNPPLVSTAFYTTPNDGIKHTYRISSWAVVTTAGTGGSVFPSVTYTTSADVITGATIGSSATVSSQWSVGQGTYTFSADPNTVVYAWLGEGGVTGSPAFLYTVTLERLL